LSLPGTVQIPVYLANKVEGGPTDFGETVIKPGDELESVAPNKALRQGLAQCFFCRNGHLLKELWQRK
jgi:hypothetical protein